MYSVRQTAAKKIIHSKDIWHVSKNISVRWISFNKKKESKKTNLDYQIYEEIKHLETTKLKTHYWYWVTQKLKTTEFKKSFVMQRTIEVMNEIPNTACQIYQSILF
jgi:hypothetical protein